MNGSDNNQADTRQTVLQELKSFVEERDWGKFHSPENLAKSISIESAELLECFQWNSEPESGDVQSELADVLTYCYLLADKLCLNIDYLILDKLQKTREKYPISKARGVSTKYDKL